MNTWLLVGLSVRPLAEAAAAAGHRVCAIDAFADRETLAACEGRVLELPIADDWRIDAGTLIASLTQAQRRFAPEGFAGVVPCGGFDGSPELVERLGEFAPLLGNRANTIATVREPRSWFALLDRIGAPHPPVAYVAPDRGEDWLVKAAGGSGGRHVRPWRGDGALAADDYFQRRAGGRPASALFIADGRRAAIVGWQWQFLSPSREQPCRYGGVMTATDLPVNLRWRIAQLVDAIVGESGLRGLCGLDFLTDGDRPLLLELNPRPTASVALYPEFDLFAWHQAGCGGRLPPAIPREVAAAGESVFYARAALAVAGDFAWPAWCCDLPAGAARFADGEPVCSVRASGASSAVVRAKLVRRLQLISIRLKEHRPHENRRKRQCQRRTADPIAAG